MVRSISYLRWTTTKRKNLMTTTTKTTIPADVLECLPAEALEAIKTGGNWDGTPDSAGDCETWYTQGDDDEWDANTYPTGYVVEDGKLLWRVMNCDADGNWEFEDEAEVGTPEHAQLEKIYGYQAWLETYNYYLAWVAKHGEDPMNEFFTTKPTITREEKWRAHVYESMLGVVALKAARPENGGWSSNAADLPASVRQYLNLSDARLAILGDFKTLAELVATVDGSEGRITKHRAPDNKRPGLVIGFTLSVTRPNPKYKQQLLRIAKASLKGRP
jgi:hypothetical protein